MPESAPDRLLGLIGDIHAEDEHLALALAVLRARGAEQILCAGDIVDGPGDVERCCELLRQASVVTVRGNHERWRLQGRMRDLPHATELARLTPDALRFLAALPANHLLPGGMLLCHGLGENDMARLMPDDEGYALESNADLQRLLERPELRIVVSGHTHRRMVRHVGHIVFINPGSLVPGQDCGVMVFCPATGVVQTLVGFETGRVEGLRVMG